MPSDFHLFDNGPELCKLTFKDIIDSYHKWLGVLQAFRRNQKIEKHFKLFDFRLEDAEKAYQNFTQFLLKKSIGHDTNLSQFAVECWKNRSTNHHTLADLDSDMFCPLFDAVLFQKIYEDSGKHIVIIAGNAHTSQVEGMLQDLNFETKIYYVSITREEYVSIAREEEKKDEDIRILSKPELTAILRGYSISDTLRKMVANVFLRVCIFVFELGKSPDPEE